MKACAERSSARSSGSSSRSGWAPRCCPLRSHLSIATAALVLVIPVVAGVIVGGFPAGVTSVAAGFLVYDFGFVPPYNTLDGRGAQNWVPRRLRRRHAPGGGVVASLESAAPKPSADGRGQAPLRTVRALGRGPLRSGTSSRPSCAPCGPCSSCPAWLLLDPEGDRLADRGLGRRTGLAEELQGSSPGREFRSASE